MRGKGLRLTSVKVSMNQEGIDIYFRWAVKKVYTIMILKDIKTILTFSIKSRRDCYADQYHRIFLVKLLLAISIIMGINWLLDSVNCMVPGNTDNYLCYESLFLFWLTCSDDSGCNYFQSISLIDYFRMNSCQTIMSWFYTCPE